MFITKGKPIAEMKETIDILAEMGYELRWYFGHLKKWIDSSNYTQDVKTKLLELTEHVENSDNE